MSQAHILVVDDEPDIRSLVSEILEDEGYSVTVAEDGAAARLAFTRDEPDLVLLDIWMPDIDGISLLKEWSKGGLGCPVVIMTGHGSVETAIEATRLGAQDFVQKPISLARLLSIVSTSLEDREAPAIQSKIAAKAIIEPVGNSASMSELREKAAQAAQHSSPVLITGESGSGREMLARFIHHRSGRDGPFIAIDHCTLAANDAATYFNDEQSGMFTQATGGSLYIPDVQDLPESAMKAIYQALEANEQASQDNDPGIPPRLIATGDPDLGSLSESNAEFEQLYFRLNVLPLHIPALRDRAEDVPDLLTYFCEWFPDHENLPYRPVSLPAQNRLRNHSWPGNVRELKNLVQQLLILGGEGEISVTEVEEALSRNPVKPSRMAPSHPEIFDLPLREAREAFERDYLIYQLGKVDGSVGKLAENVGMERTHLYRKLRALSIDPKAVVRQGEKT
ncbi:MAG TPA: sigma-54 dependent transcriptional regulator [Xanthomonadales bacterium]|nr:sigma-54 dependent transcriptional regulator [Xanthomonadales bacterium]